MFKGGGSAATNSLFNAAPIACVRACVRVYVRVCVCVFVCVCAEHNVGSSYKFISLGKRGLVALL